MAALGVLFGSCSALASALALVRRLLDRRRLRDWDEDWLAFGRHRGTTR